MEAGADKAGGESVGPDRPAALPWGHGNMVEDNAAGERERVPASSEFLNTTGLEPPATDAGSEAFFGDCRHGPTVRSSEAGKMDKRMPAPAGAEAGKSREELQRGDPTITGATKFSAEAERLPPVRRVW